MLVFLLHQRIILREIVNECFDFGKESVNLLEERGKKAEDGDKADGFEGSEMAVNFIDEVKIFVEHFQEILRNPLIPLEP